MTKLAGGRPRPDCAMADAVVALSVAAAAAVAVVAGMWWWLS